jgi:hypothetical protein
VPSLRRILGAFLIAALLAAQQAALEHPLWHVGAADQSSPLCAQHDALGTVAGGIHCAAPVLAAEAPAAAAIVSIVPAARAGAPLEPSSRGPPSLL